MGNTDEENYRACLTGLTVANNHYAITDDQECAARLWLERLIELAEPIIG